MKSKSEHLTENIIWTGLIGLAIALVLVFGLSMKNIVDAGTIKGKLQDGAQQVAERVGQNLTSLKKTVEELRNQYRNDENAEELIRNALPESMRVLVVEEPVDAIAPKVEFPAINFATLDMLKRISTEQTDLTPEIHLWGQKYQYLNFVNVISKDNKYLVVSFPVESIFEGLKPLQFDKGNVTLTQKSNVWSSVDLKYWGVASKGDDYFLGDDLAIPDSFFHVSYSYHKPFSLLGNVGTLPTGIGFIGSLILLFASYSQRKRRLDARKEKEDREAEERKNTYVPKSMKHKTEGEESTASPQLDDKTQKPAALPSNELQLPDASIFKAYDIRGIVDETLTKDAVLQIGQAIGTENKRRGGDKIVVARDGRLSGPSLLESLIEGLVNSGNEVINIGAVPTGVLYFATHHLNTGSGVMLTGSHNPPNYNGLKIVLQGETLSGESIKHLYHMIENKDLESGEGSVQEIDIADDYIDQISSDVQLENELKVVVDCGNGIAGNIAPELLEEIGCEVIPLHCEVDGNFPNHHPDPSVPENMQDLITTLQSLDADIGIAFDGDGDRLGVVTKAGEIIYPDRLLMLFAKDVLTRVPGSSIIFDVKCTGHLPKSIVKSGGMPIMWKTGHSFMKAKLKETDAALAGEMSGHFFFNERWYGFDDGIYSAARLLEILDQEDRDPQEVFDELPKGVSTPELKAEMAEGEHYAFMEDFQEKCQFPDAKITSIDGIRADFSDGWGLVRCSNTTPCLVIRFDADDEEALERIKNEFRKQIHAVNEEIELPF
ncbi:phosphomannomutase/phosphoglucomutase [Marinicella sp. W31]|uniref:phosphomannomutase/phosphoglucomutase n=1 Tax=Marinicella sp. W31 TaxID=3023713 RepID=UPI0037579329